MANEHLVYDGAAPAKPIGYAEKLHWCLVADTSSSMDGKPIETVSREMQQLVKKIQQDSQALEMVEISLVTFDTNAHVIRGPQPVGEMNIPDLEAGGTTNIVAGVRRAIQVVETRKTVYKEQGLPYFRAVICVITDGLPFLENGEQQDLAGLAREIKEGTDQQQFICKFFGTDQADINILRELSHPDFPPTYVQNNDYPSIFEWLYNGIGFLMNSQDKDEDYIQLTTQPVTNGN